MLLQLRTTVPFGHLLGLIQHQFQRVFLCHFPNYKNSEIGDQIHVAALQSHQHILQHYHFPHRQVHFEKTEKLKGQKLISITAFYQNVGFASNTVITKKIVNEFFLSLARLRSHK